jgi:anti-sigma regulatory factor (Ser/Thr protein kinase)
MPANIILVLPDGAADAARELADRIRDDDWSVHLVTAETAVEDAIRNAPAALLLADAQVWDHAPFRAAVTRAAPSIPVVVLTRGDEASETLVKHLKLGAATFVPRSSSKRELLATIRSLIDLTTRNPYRERVREFLHAGEVEMRLDNDPGTIGVAVGFLHDLMDGYRIADEPTRVRIGIALSEALSNAMIHGNLEIASDLRAANSDAYFDAIEQRLADPRFAARRVHLIVRLRDRVLAFTIRDHGKGFRVQDVPDPTNPENLMRLSGRGILMMRAYADRVSWNDKGNEVTLEKDLSESSDNP